MDVLKLNKECSSSDLLFLCQLLHTAPTPTFNEALDSKVKDFQSSQGLTPDGIVGWRTWVTLLKVERDKFWYSDNPTPWDYDNFSRILGVEPATLKAVEEVETGGKGGFLTNGKPRILFEGHAFWKELAKLAKTDPKYNPFTLSKKYPNIVYQTWTKSNYYGGAKEYERFEKACKIDKKSAILSTSWGMFQLMGYNYKLCGFSSVEDMYAAMYRNQFEQFLAGIEFIRSRKLDKYLATKSWADFAYRYNGVSYAKNNYDTKLKAAYEKYSKTTTLK